MKINKFVKPFMPPVWRIQSRIAEKDDFQLRRDNQKYFLGALQIRLGRQKESILDYVQKNDKKRRRIQAVKG